MRRGRPKHPDILTPREWEVLGLLREGLTNPQIADRLGISEHGVKYHVLEILSKLGVSSRYEAAAWQREPVGVSRRYGFVAALLALRLPKPGGFSVSKVGMVLLAAGVAGFLGVLAMGVVIMNERASSESAAVISPAEASPGTTVVATATVPPTSTPTYTPTSTSTLTPTPTPTLAPASTQTLPPGAIPPPPGTAGPGFTPSATPTLPPNVLTELPISASEALTAFAASVGATYAGECSPSAQVGALCFRLQDGTPSFEGTDIRVRLRVVEQLLDYDVLLTQDTAGNYQVASSSGPNAFSIEPP